MSQVRVTETSLETIADAIRAKLGVQTTYRPSEMAAAIQSIPTGGSAVLEHLSVTENGTYTPGAGVDGFDQVTVNVSGGGGATAHKLKVGALTTPVPAISEIGPMTATNGYIVPLNSDNSEAKLDLSQPFEIGCKFKIGSSPASGGNNIWGSIDGYYGCPTIAVYPNAYHLFVTTNGSSWQHNVVFGSAPPTDTYIFAKLTWDGTNISAFVDDGTNQYTQVIENVTPYYSSAYRFEFGGQNQSGYSIAVLNAIIDLDGTYLKQGNTVIWGTDS